MTDHGFFQFSIPTNYTCKRLPSTQKIFPVQFFLPYLTPLSQNNIVNLSDKAGAKCIFESIYGAAVMEKETVVRKATSTQSYLAAFDQEERWIIKDSPEVST